MPEDEHDDLTTLRAFARDRQLEPVSWEAPPADLWARIEAAAGTDEVEDESAGGGVVLRPQPSRWFRPGLLAAAAVVAVAVAAVAILQPWDRSPSETLVAATPLEPLTEVGSGRAELIQRDGAMQLRLDTTELDPGADGFLEVWVIDTDVSQLVSLGPLRSDGLYDLPAGLDPEAFPVVDVSIEPLDGDPTHSGDSVLRGQLRF